MKSAAKPLELHAGMNVPVAINCEQNIYYILNLDLLRLFQCVAATVSHFGMHDQPKEYWHCTCCNTFQLCRLFPRRTFQKRSCLEWYLSTVSTIDYASAFFMMGRKWTWTGNESISIDWVEQQTHGSMLTIISF
jgi:hypothetical protein